MENKNDDVSQVRSSLKERKKRVLQRVKSLKENRGAMTDIIFAENSQRADETFVG